MIKHHFESTLFLLKNKLTAFAAAPAHFAEESLFLLIVVPKGYETLPLKLFLQTF